MRTYAHMSSPVGRLTVVSDERGLCSIAFGRRSPDGRHDPEGNARTLTQLREYFSGDRRAFDLRLALSGTAFQLAVWSVLRDIPYGETRSYGEIAAAVGKPGAARAVGMANHANPIPIVVPCHRVIGHDGRLTGYGGGLDTKARLLHLEGANGVKENRATSGRARGRFTVLAKATH